MARPLKTGLDYFPHDTHPDKKLERFYLLYEAKGKSFWNTMLEEIYAEGWKLSVADPETIQILAKKAFLTVEEWNLMLATALRMDLFDLGFYEEQHVLTSNGIKRRWEVVAQKRLTNQEYYSRKAAEKEAAKPAENKFRMSETPTETPLSDGFHLRAKEKERKDPPSEDQIPLSPEFDSKAEQPRRKGRAKGPRTICPEDFQVSEKTAAWCRANGHPDPAQPFVDDFVNYWRNRGDLGADWQAAFRNYMAGPFRLDKKEAKYGQNGSGWRGSKPTRGEQLDRDASELLREFGGAPAGGPQADRSHVPVGRPGEAGA